MTHQEGSRQAFWCEELRQIGAGSIDQLWERACSRKRCFSCHLCCL